MQVLTFLSFYVFPEGLSSSLTKTCIDLSGVFEATSNLKKNPYILIYSFRDAAERNSLKIPWQIEMLKVHELSLQGIWL